METSTSTWSLSCNYCGVKQKQLQWSEPEEGHPGKEMDTWSDCRMAGQEWELGPVGSLDPGGPWLECVRLGSSRSRTGCSGGPGRSCEGRGLYLFGTDPSPACELR